MFIQVASASYCIWLNKTFNQHGVVNAGNHSFLIAQTLDSLVIALGVSALLTLNGKASSMAMVLKLTVFFVQWTVTFIDLACLKGWAGACSTLVPGMDTGARSGGPAPTRVGNV